MQPIVPWTDSTDTYHAKCDRSGGRGIGVRERGRGGEGYEESRYTHLAHPRIHGPLGGCQRGQDGGTGAL